MFCGGVAASAILFGALGGRREAQAADEMPAQLQAELITRLAAYDRNMKARVAADGGIATLVVFKPGDVDSERASTQLAAALGRFDRIGSFSHRSSTTAYAGAAALAATCKSNRVGVVVLSPALASDGDSLRAAFDGVDILSVSPSIEMTRLGASVLGFELVSSRPKLFINLTQAGKQNVALPADILKLMTVFR